MRLYTNQYTGHSGLPVSESAQTDIHTSSSVSSGKSVPTTKAEGEEGPEGNGRC